jgi:hypothetical protein
MTAVPFTPARPLCDVRPRRGKHRTRRSLTDVSLSTWRVFRAEVAVAAATVGGLLAATVLS